MTLGQIYTRGWQRNVAELDMLKSCKLFVKNCKYEKKCMLNTSKPQFRFEILAMEDIIEVLCN